MKSGLDAHDKLDAQGGSPEADYGVWKRAKIEVGMAQAKDRAAMIPAEHIWSDLQLDVLTVLHTRRRYPPA